MIIDKIRSPSSPKSIPCQSDQSATNFDYSIKRLVSLARYRLVISKRSQPIASVHGFALLVYCDAAGKVKRQIHLVIFMIFDILVCKKVTVNNGLPKLKIVLFTFDIMIYIKGWLGYLGYIAILWILPGKSSVYLPQAMTKPTCKLWLTSSISLPL